MTVRLSKIFIFLVIATSAMAQCDSALSICDSVTVAQSNEIVRLQGEVKNRECDIRALHEIFSLSQASNKIMTDWQDERYEDLKKEKWLHERLFIGWTIISILFLIIVR